MTEGRTVAGIHCMEVLELLDDYVDDTLDLGSRAKIEAHLRGCEWCTSFGGRYAELTRQLRNELLSAPSPGAGRALAERLLESDEPT